MNLADLYRNAGMMAEAAEVAAEGIVVSERLGIERRKGVWCRCDAAEALIALGDSEARRCRGRRSPGPARRGRTAHRLPQRAPDDSAGDFAAASEYLERARTNGAHLLDDQLVGPLFQGSSRR